MAYREPFGHADEYRREELIRQIVQAVERLSLQELEALHYDMVCSKNYSFGEDGAS